MRTLALFALPLALAACGQNRSPSDDVATGAASADETGASAAPATTAPAQSPTASDTTGVPEFGIPVALQGNWGMVPADCTSTRGDAKGLLRISGTTLTFYESVGRLGTIKNRTDSSIRADFGFTGEGMTWSRDVELSASGDTLTRTERGGEEPGGPFTYTRCAA